MDDEPMTLERLRERLDLMEGRDWRIKVEARGWILRGCAALHQELAHWREAARSVGEADGHGWAMTTGTIRDELARLEEESRQWEKASLVKIMEERDEFRREAARMTDLWRKTRAAATEVENERNEQRAFVRWYESLMARADVGSPETPTLRAYIERLEARVAQLEEQCGWLE